MEALLRAKMDAQKEQPVATEEIDVGLDVAIDGGTALEIEETAAEPEPGSESAAAAAAAAPSSLDGLSVKHKAYLNNKMNRRKYSAATVLKQHSGDGNGALWCMAAVVFFIIAIILLLTSCPQRAGINYCGPLGEAVGRALLHASAFPLSRFPAFLLSCFSVPRCAFLLSLLGEPALCVLCRVARLGWAGQCTLLTLSYNVSQSVCLSRLVFLHLPYPVSIPPPSAVASNLAWNSGLRWHRRSACTRAHLVNNSQRAYGPCLFTVGAATQPLVGARVGAGLVEGAVKTLIDAEVGRICNESNEKRVRLALAVGACPHLSLADMAYARLWNISSCLLRLLVGLVLLALYPLIIIADFFLTSLCGSARLAARILWFESFFAKHPDLDTFAIDDVVATEMRALSERVAQMLAADAADGSRATELYVGFTTETDDEKVESHDGGSNGWISHWYVVWDTFKLNFYTSAADAGAGEEEA